MITCIICGRKLLSSHLYRHLKKHLENKEITEKFWNDYLQYGYVGACVKLQIRRLKKLEK